MRAIKFRAWDKKYNIMLEPEAFNRNDVWISGDGKVYEIEEWSGYGGGGKREHDCTDQYILMQYTGLKDRNGKEIYEGDLLNGSEVYWSPQWAVFTLRGGDVGALVRFADIYEIIGNIYEKGADNP